MNTTRQTFITSLIFAATFTTPAAAEKLSSEQQARLDSIEKAWEIELNQVVVTGTRTPKLLKDTPILTRIITEADIKRTDASTISDMLQTELPGIEFSYSMNQQVNLNMQGFGGNSVLFLVDGERMAGETLDNIDYNRLDLNNTGRVEIVKGGASALYGSNAVGGVVNIISRESKEPWHLNLSARYGSHNEQRYGAVASFNARRVTSATTVRYSSIDSYGMKVTEANKDENAYSRFYGGYNVNLRERLTWNPIDSLRLTARAGYYFRQRNSAVTTSDRYRDFSAGLKSEYRFGHANDLELAYAFDQYDKSDYLRPLKRDVRKYRNVQNSLRAIYNHVILGRHTLTVGADMMRDYLQSYQFTNNGHKSQLTLDGFAQIDLSLARGWNLVAGGRYDYFSDASMKHFSGRLSTMYRVGNCSLRASYAGGFRAPTLKEMYMDFDMAGIFMIYGNANLQPETSHNFQISADYTHRLLNVTLGGFCNLVDNRITTAWNDELKGQVYTNIGRVDIAGVEANVAWRSSLGLGARAAYVYTYEHVHHGEPYAASTRPHTATLRLDYTHNWKNYGITAAINGRYLSPVNVDEFTSISDYSQTQRVHYPGYTMWRLTLTNSIWRGIDLTVTIDNLFNYVPKVYNSNSPSTDGTTFALGVSVDVERFFKK